jgi:alpha,alpha-trehalase
MSAAKNRASVRDAAKEPQKQSAAAPSPFPPIADYAFLSNCHTGALVAPDGAVDWLCVPRFDAPSVFGSLLDREAGSFRFGPFGINHPTTRIYEPGTNVLATTWKSPSGWILIRDALTIGPQDHEDKITPHTRPPTDEDADHLLVRTVVCLEGRVEIEFVCEPAFDYGRMPAEWSAVDGDRHVADASGAEQTIRLRSDLALGIEGSRVRARHVLGPGDRAYCALSWAEGLATPQHADEAEARIAATIRYWRA